MLGLACRRLNDRCSSTRSPTAWRRIWSFWLLPRRSTTASRSARREERTFRLPSIISGISPAASAPRKARSPRSTTIRSHTISRNFPLLMAAWKIAPALAAGNCTFIKPASNTPLTLLILAGLTADILPPGVLNVVTGPGGSVGQAIAANPRISKISFTGETTTGKQIMRYAAEHLISQTMELGGKSPNIFMADVMDADDDFFDKALEGFALFAFNKGEVCTCPSRALIQESIFDKFMERAIARVARIKVGDPLDAATQMGAQASEEQLKKILSYIKIGKEEGARCMTGGKQAHLGGDLENGYYVQPTVFVGHNRMRIFQDEI